MLAVVLFVMLWKMVLTFESVDEILKYHRRPFKFKEAINSTFQWVCTGLFIMLYKVVLRC